jgi:23S rRNA (guanine745-N1)-methyltransferase
MNILACPVCSAPLARADKIYRCAANHAFDIAREGYVNLLLAQQKKTSDPGDNKEMVTSRSAFLDAGHYNPLSDALNQRIAALAERASDPPLQLLDAGCGEGFYLRRLAAHLAASAPACDLWGIDIARSAVRAAARRDKKCQFAVANTYRLPVLAESLHAVCRIFAPGDDTELHRVLHSDGLLFSIAPGPQHLHQLKALCYETPRPHKSEETPAGFARIDQQQIGYWLHLENAAIGHLLHMTPYYWHLNPETQQRVLALDALHVQTDFMLSIYQKI